MEMTFDFSCTKLAVVLVDAKVFIFLIITYNIYYIIYSYYDYKLVLQYKYLYVY